MDIEVLFGDDCLCGLMKIAPEEMRVKLQHIETPQPPRLIADDRPAWQTKYGPPQRGRR